MYIDKKNLFVKFLIPFLLISSFFHCGRKPRNIFSFDPEKNSHFINPLSLSPIKEIKLTKIKNKNIISWQKITIATPKTELCGYNIYRFASHAFVPQNPLNSTPLTTTQYEDSPSLKYRWCYIVRGVFKTEENIIEGPASQIVCEKKI